MSAESTVLWARRANKLPPTDHVTRLPNFSSIAEGNLRRYIEVLGGALKIAAHFGEASAVIENIGEPTAAARQHRARAAIGQSRSQEYCSHHIE